MNAKTLAAVMRHGRALQAIFPAARSIDPVELCRKLRRIERQGEELGLRLCNGPEYPEGEADAVAECILANVAVLLEYKAAGVPVILNRDPRGYALKIDDEYMRKTGAKLYSDFGGYGIIAPDLSENN